MTEEGKVHVGNLSFNVSEEEIRDAFEKYGPVENGRLFWVKRLRPRGGTENEFRLGERFGVLSRQFCEVSRCERGLRDPEKAKTFKTVLKAG